MANTTISISKETLELIQKRRDDLKKSNPGFGVRKDLSNGRIVHQLLVGVPFKESLLE